MGGAVNMKTQDREEKCDPGSGYTAGRAKCYVPKVAVAKTTWKGTQ